MWRTGVELGAMTLEKGHGSCRVPAWILCSTLIRTGGGVGACHLWERSSSWWMRHWEQVYSISLPPSIWREEWQQESCFKWWGDPCENTPSFRSFPGWMRQEFIHHLLCKTSKMMLSEITGGGVLGLLTKSVLFSQTHLSLTERREQLWALKPSKTEIFMTNWAATIKVKVQGGNHSY